MDGIIEIVGADDAAQLLSSDGLAIKIKGVISTQSAGLDAAIGRGGVPTGRLTIIWGPEGCGKTTLAGHLVAEVQRLGGVAVYIDKEYKLDPEYFASLGVDCDSLIISQPPYLEKAFKVFDAVIDKAAKLRENSKKRYPILIVLDSMNAAITKAEYEGDYEDKHYAPQAGVYSRLLPKLIPKVNKEDVALVWIAQTRTKIGVQYGDPNGIAGGNAPKFYSSLMMRVNKKKVIVEDGGKVGQGTEVVCTKNQIAPPFKRANFDIVYGKGIAIDRSLFDQAVKDDIIHQSGSWYTWRGETLGHGKGDSILELKNNGWMEELYNDVAEKNKWEKRG